jgi:Txe/YoeB family toxin of toxin-antitoxin system
MEAITYTAARQNLAKTMEKVCKCRSPIIVTSKKILRRTNTLIKETKRSPFEGVGKPEPLKHALSGYWSRRTRLCPCKTDPILVVVRFSGKYLFDDQSLQSI